MKFVEPRKFDGHTVEEMMTYLNRDLRGTLREWVRGFTRLGNENLADDSKITLSTDWQPIFPTVGGLVFTPTQIRRALFLTHNNFVLALLNIVGTTSGVNGDTIRFSAPTLVDLNQGGLPILANISDQSTFFDQAGYNTYNATAEKFEIKRSTGNIGLGTNRLISAIAIYLRP